MSNSLQTNPRTGSIAKRLNAALVRRKFFRTLLLDIAIILLIFGTWCLTVEAQYGGHVTNVSERTLAGWETADDNLVALVNDVTYAPSSVTYGDGVIFRGTVYAFAVDGVRYTDDASLILSVLSETGVILLILQFIMFVVGHFTGRGLIKRYLRPIDDIALSAERLSSMQQSVSDPTPGSELDSDRNEEVASLAHAINAIDDSDKRVAVHDSELGGLEAAVNNMLKRLEESKRKQIRFVDDASHELRTPIAVIQGYVNMLDRWGKDDPKVMEESISAIKHESEHMKTLIDQLLFLARGDMERHVIHKMPLDTNELMEEVVEECRMIDTAHEYSFETDGKPHTVNADPAMLKQVLRILTDNAAKYTPKSGLIKLRTFETAGTSGTSGRVCMEVSDTGIGIPNDELPRIFDRFYRGQDLRGDSNGGSGLGLSIAKWIVDEHSGTITAISSEGIGTKMTVSLSAAV